MYNPNKKLNLGFCGQKLIRAEQDEGLVKLLFDKWFFKGNI